MPGTLLWLRNPGNKLYGPHGRITRHALEQSLCRDTSGEANLWEAESVRLFPRQ